MQSTNFEYEGIVGEFLEADVAEEVIVEFLSEHPPDGEPSLPDQELKNMISRIARQHAASERVMTGVFTAAELAEAKVPDLELVIDRIVPSGFTLFAGKPKEGKSFMALGMAVDKAMGNKVMGSLAAKKRGVLYLALEDGARRIKKRLTSICGGRHWPANLHFVTDWPRLDNGGRARLETWLQDHPEVGLVIIDTFPRVRPLAKAGQKSLYECDYEASSMLQGLANQRNVAILAVVHTRKAPSDDPFDLVSGTFGLTGAADTIWILQRNKGRAEATLRVKGRDIDEQEMALSFDQSRMRWEIRGEAADYTRSPERQKIIDVIKKDGRSMRPGEVAKAIGKTEGSVRKLMKTMKDQGDLVSSARGMYAIPPKPITESNTDHNGNIVNEPEYVKLSPDSFI